MQLPRGWRKGSVLGNIAGQGKPIPFKHRFRARHGHTERGKGKAYTGVRQDMGYIEVRQGRPYSGESNAIQVVDVSKAQQDCKLRVGAKSSQGCEGARQDDATRGKAGQRCVCRGNARPLL